MSFSTITYFTSFVIGYFIGLILERIISLIASHNRLVLILFFLDEFKQMVYNFIFETPFPFQQIRIKIKMINNILKAFFIRIFN